MLLKKIEGIVDIAKKTIVERRANATGLITLTPESRK